MFLDIGMGIIGTIIFSHILHIEILVFVLIISIIFALLPDVDFIFKLAKYGGEKILGMSIEIYYTTHCFMYQLDSC